ncbi:nucleotidyltransferase domain-containing protein [Nostoc sp. NIES-2111]
METTGDLDRQDLLARLRALAPVLRGKGVTSAYLFGSRARGDAGSESDIDLVVDGDPTRGFTHLDIAGVSEAVGSAVALRAHAVLARTAKTAFRTRIADDLIEIF